MARTNAVVRIWFGTSTLGGNVFTLDDPVKGVLDSATYLLGGDTGTDVSADVLSYEINRGRPSLIFEEIDAGTARVRFRNGKGSTIPRAFDPLYTAGPYYGLLTPGRKVTIEADGVTLFTGRVRDWDIEYSHDKTSVATLIAEDALATLARKTFDDWTATASQTAGPRLTAILNRTEVAWPGGQRDLDTGISTLQGDTVSWGSSVLNYCQLVAKSDGPASFFASRTGVLTFRDRHANLLGTSRLTFSDTGTGVRIESASIQAGSETYYTRVSVDRAGGVVQSYSDSSASTADVITWAISGVLQDSDAQALDMATYYATVYATGEARVSEVTTTVDSSLMSVADKQALLALELNDLVSVTWTPGGVGSAISSTVVVSGIEHKWNVDQHTVTVKLAKYDSRAPFVLDSSVLDGPNVLVF